VGEACYDESGRIAEVAAVAGRGQSPQIGAIAKITHQRPPHTLPMPGGAFGPPKVSLFSVVATNTLGSATSNNATLIVNSKSILQVEQDSGRRAAKQQSEIDSLSATLKAQAADQSG
jgi:hypothetical protein